MILLPFGSKILIKFHTLLLTARCAVNLFLFLFRFANLVVYQKPLKCFEHSSIAFRFVSALEVTFALLNNSLTWKCVMYLNVWVKLMSIGIDQLLNEASHTTRTSMQKNVVFFLGPNRNWHRFCCCFHPISLIDKSIVVTETLIYYYSITERLKQIDYYRLYSIV